ncbi:MAG: hypothetical protein ACKVLA_17060 [Rhodobacterales bacterium]
MTRPVPLVARASVGARRVDARPFALDIARRARVTFAAGAFFRNRVAGPPAVAGHHNWLVTDHRGYAVG